MKKSVKAIIAVVLIVILAYGGYAVYSIYIQGNGSNTCEAYLRTDCGGNHNAITYDTSTGDITVPNVAQSYGSTYYNVAVAYVPGNTGEATGGVFVADPGDIPGNTLNSGQHVTINNLSATGPAVAGTTYNGTLWIAYTKTSGGTSCAGPYSSSSPCQYDEIGTITLKG